MIHSKIDTGILHGGQERTNVCESGVGEYSPSPSAVFVYSFSLLKTIADNVYESFIPSLDEFQHYSDLK